MVTFPWTFATESQSSQPVAYYSGVMLPLSFKIKSLKDRHTHNNQFNQNLKYNPRAAFFILNFYF